MVWTLWVGKLKLAVSGRSSVGGDEGTIEGVTVFARLVRERYY